MNDGMAARVEPVASPGKVWPRSDFEPDDLAVEVLQRIENVPAPAEVDVVQANSRHRGSLQTKGRMPAYSRGASSAQALARRKDCVVAVRLGHQQLLHVNARFEVGNGLAAIHHLGDAGKAPLRDRLEVVDLDLDGGADLALGQRWVERGAHPGVGQRVHDGSVHYAMRVEMLLRHVQAE